jgi:succinate dehydrogenase/fumarate reductase flavoprotein subunit
MDRDYWTEKLREAEQELDAATTLTAVKAAAKKLQRAKAELKELRERTKQGKGQKSHSLVRIIATLPE